MVLTQDPSTDPNCALLGRSPQVNDGGDHTSLLDAIRQGGGKMGLKKSNDSSPRSSFVRKKKGGGSARRGSMANSQLGNVLGNMVTGALATRLARMRRLSFYDEDEDEARPSPRPDSPPVLST